MINTPTHNQVHFNNIKEQEISKQDTQVSEMNTTSSQENNYSISSEEMLPSKSSNKEIQNPATYESKSGVYFKRQVKPNDQNCSNTKLTYNDLGQSLNQNFRQDPKILVSQVKHLWGKFFKNYQRSFTMVLEHTERSQGGFKEEEFNLEANLKQLIEQALQLSDIRMSQYQQLENFDQIILSNFIQKKFKIKCQCNLKSDSEFLAFFQKNIKTKRNEEILKFVLKGFFKYLCKIKQKTYPKKNFFQLKKEISMDIFSEICEELNLNIDQFLSESFIDRKKLIIKVKDFFFPHFQLFEQLLYPQLQEKEN